MVAEKFILNACKRLNAYFGKFCFMTSLYKLLVLYKHCEGKRLYSLKHFLYITGRCHLRSTNSNFTIENLVKNAWQISHFTQETQIPILGNKLKFKNIISHQTSIIANRAQQSS